MKLLILVLLGVVTLTSCSGGGVASEFYVVIKPDEATKFIGAVIAIAKDDGIEIAEVKIPAGVDDILRIVEGQGHGMDIWVESALLSGHEDPKLCGVYSKPHSDPAQFSVFTEPGFFGSRAVAKEFGERMFSLLQKSGFDVRRKPALCGAAALRNRSAVS